MSGTHYKKAPHSSGTVILPLGTCFASLDEDGGLHYYRQDPDRVLHVRLAEEGDFIINAIADDFLIERMRSGDFTEIALTEFEAALEKAKSFL